MSSGFTKNELAAALFSKKFKKEDEPNALDSKKERERFSDGRSKERNYDRGSDYYERNRDKNRDKEREKRRSDGPSYSPYRGNRDNSPIKWEKDKYSFQHSPTISQRNRDSSRDRDRSREREREKERERERERFLRSDKPPPDPVYEYDDYRTNSGADRRRERGERNERNERRERGERNERRERSRSRERERERERGVESVKWIHDLHSADEPELLPMPGDYRPPSPSWTSRAGGVAILRKK